MRIDAYSFVLRNAILTATIQYLRPGRIAQIFLLLHQMVQIREMLSDHDHFSVQFAILIVVGTEIIFVTSFLFHAAYCYVVPEQIPSILRK